jgi:hypothetical protein
MTPKEKAKELVERFINSDSMIFSLKGAKECALIAVDELIKQTGSKYWYDVKLEIENL